MNKKIIIWITISALFGIIAVMAENNDWQFNANDNGETADKTQTQSVQESADKIEVYYFHRTQRCYSCLTLGQYLKETIEQEFSEEIKSGRIDFREINIDLPENKDMAIKFQASGSSLFVNAIKDGQDNINQDTNVWRLLSNKVQFKNYLENKINLFL